jgi:hypothetical protein
MDNDQGIYELQNEWADQAMDIKDNDKSNAAYALADMVESFWDDLAAEQSQTGFFADLMNRGLGMIDWHEIAENILSDIDVYAAGWDMPGFMPESEPALFRDSDQALDYIREEIARYGEEIDESDDAIKHAQDSVSLESSVLFGKYAFFVSRV